MNWVRLGDIASYINGYAFKPSDWHGSGLPIIRIQNLTNEYAEYNYTTNEIDEKYLIKNGDILISWSATLGVFQWDRGDAYLNQHIFKVVFDKDDINKDFFKYAVKYSLEKSSKNAHGSTMKHLTRKNFEKIKIPKYTLDKQKKIANLLEKAEKLIKIRQDQIQALDDLLESSFYQMFGDIISTKYDVLKIDEIAKSTQYGTSKKADDKTGNYPILRMGNITYNGLLDLNDLKYIDISDDEKDKYLVKNGDILFNRTNSKELVGKTAIYNLDQEMAYAGYLIRLRVNEKINPIFLSRQMNMSFFKKTLFIKAKASINMSNINSKELKEFKIICPPIEKQNKFADLVTKIEGQKGILEDSLSELSDLFASLMQDAFDGSLSK